MADVYPKEVRGGSGLKSTEVNRGAGFLKQVAHNRTEFDFSGAAATENAFACSATGATIQRVLLAVDEVIAAAASFKVGVIRGGTATADYFMVSTATAAAVAAGTVVVLADSHGTSAQMTALAQTQILQGDVLTVNSVGTSGGTGTGTLIVEYVFDDENN